MTYGERESELQEGQEFGFELIHYEFDSMYQNFVELPIVTSSGKFVTAIESGETFSLKVEQILTTDINQSMVLYQLIHQQNVISGDEDLNQKIRNTDVFSIDFFHSSFSDKLKSDILLPYVSSLKSEINKGINTTGQAIFTEDDEEFGVKYSSNYFSNDSSNQILNVVWEYRFDKTTGVLRKYHYQLDQNIIVYGQTGPAYRDIASRNIELNERGLVERKILLPLEFLIGISAVMLIAGGYAVYRIILARSKPISKMIVNNQITQIVKEVFGNYATSYFIIGENFVKREDIDPEAVTTIPHELLDYKFLMSPVRLSIAKLLMENTILTLAELRNQLGVSWGELSTNTKAMESRGFIHVEEKIVNDTIKKTAVLEPLGIAEYEKLIKLLITFIDQSPLYDKYINNALHISKEGKN